MNFAKIYALLKPETTRYAWWEHWIMRLGLVCLLLRGWPEVTHFTGQPRPNGLAHFIDFTFLANPDVIFWMRAVFAVCLTSYVIGIGRMVTLPVLTAILLCAGTLGNSQGAINHGTQILMLVLVAQIISVWYSGLVLRRKFTDRRAFRQQSEDHLISASIQAIAAVYVVSGITKVINSGGKWILNIPNLAVQFGKNLDMAYYNNLLPPAGNTEAVIHWVTHWPNTARLIFGTGLLLELFAFLALINRKWACFMGIALLLMHETISRIMHLGFLHNKALLLIFWINIPFGVFWLYKRFFRKTIPQQSATAS